METSGQVVSTTTIGHDSGGREACITVVGSDAPNGDRPVPTTATGYLPQTGLAKSVTADGHTATTACDALGRVTSLTDGAGSTATTTYDTAGRVATLDDGKVTTTYT